MILSFSGLRNLDRDITTDVRRPHNRPETGLEKGAVPLRARAATTTSRVQHVSRFSF
jgi:hypothetical protein